MSWRVGATAAALVLVSGCGGSETVTTGGKAAEGNDHLLECHQLGIDWVTQTDDLGVEVVFGEASRLDQVRAFGVDQAEGLEAANCEQKFVQELLDGNAGFEAMLAEVATCLETITPSAETQEFCNDARDVYDQEVLPHVNWVRDLIAADRPSP